jgi:Cof subfamily protein (haloacid dehalogenase superfamily)
MIKYKALISDCDGTLIPNRPDGRPSAAVKKAVTDARKRTHVVLATSRPYGYAKPILDELSLTGPNIIHSGAVIMDPTTGHIYKEHHLNHDSILILAEECAKKKYPLYVDEYDKSFVLSNRTQLVHPVYGAFITCQLDETAANEFISIMRTKTPDMVIHTIPSWDKGATDISFSPILATKQHGIQEVAELLSIDPAEMIGVGDGQNDFPLLMACGLKIAMGNAVPELKSIADYVAPSVEDDGIVDIIEKFILQT